MKPKSILDKHHIFSFGKYKGWTANDVILEDPQYIIWCAENIEWLDCTTDFYELARELADDINEYYYWDGIDFNE